MFEAGRNTDEATLACAGESELAASAAAFTRLERQAMARKILAAYHLGRKVFDRHIAADYDRYRKKMPDNAAVDSDGRLWVSTDGNSPSDTGRTDGLWAVDTEGEARGTSRLFYRVPVGAELCGPCPTADMTTFFVAVQHPGDGGEDWDGHGRPSFYEDLSTRWPDFDEAMPVRPAVVAITRQGGGRIGSA